MDKFRLPLVAGLLVIIGIGVAIFSTGSSNVENGRCGQYRTDRVAKVGSQKIKLEEAKNNTTQEKGLGGRPCIEANRGMLFSFAKPGHYAVWMKDMKFPIDIIWLNTNHLVVAMEKEVAPSTYPDKFVNKDKLAQYILELQAGKANNLHLNIGTRINF